MQQNQQHRFPDGERQPVYRFPQNRPAQGYMPQPGFEANRPEETAPSLSRKDQRDLKHAHRHRRRRVFTWWNLFAVIGIITVIVQAARYIVVPLLVYLNVLAGGAL